LLKVKVEAEITKNKNMDNPPLFSIFFHIILLRSFKRMLPAFVYFTYSQNTEELIHKSLVSKRPLILDRVKAF
jgi:hypothetical protein